MALVEGCKHEIELTIPAEEVAKETEKVVADLQKKVRLQGFRPGKAPASLVRSKFSQEIRKEVLDNLLPRFFSKQVEEAHLEVVGQPSVKDLHFHDGEEIHCKAEFEVAPVIELGEYRGVTVPYREPVVTDADVQERLDSIRDSKAEYVNVDPRPIEDGDHVVISLRSIAGLDSQMEQDEVTLHIGSEETLPAFTEGLRGSTPGDEMDLTVTYPEDYGQEKLSGKTVTFHAVVKAIRRKELPELNDEFARDLGDFQTLEELTGTVRKTIFRERELRAQQETKEKILDKLVASHDFPVPEAYVERQIENQLDTQLRQLVGQGIDPRKLNIDWDKLKESQRERAIKDVKASLLVDKIADREAVIVRQEEVDREVQRIAKQRREAVAVTRATLEKDGTVRRIAGHIRTEKTLDLLFENARKEAPAEE